MADMASGGGGQPVPRDRRRDARLVMSGVAAVLLVWFALVNLQDVPIHFWLWSTKSPLIVVIVIAGLLGAALSLLLSRVLQHRRRPGKAAGSGGPMP